MSSKPNAKYDWNTYLPRILQLHETGMSIPKIHAKIQDPANGFKPSLRMLYLKLNNEGHSTEYTRGALHQLGGMSTGPGATKVAGNDDGRNLQIPTLYSTTEAQNIAGQNIAVPENIYRLNQSGHTTHHKSGLEEVQNQNPINGDWSHGMAGYGQGAWNNSVQDSGPIAGNVLDMSWSHMTLDPGFGAQEIFPDPNVAQIPYSTLCIPCPGPGLMPLLEADRSRWSMETDVTMSNEVGMPSSRNNDYQHSMCTPNQKRQHNSFDNTSLPDRSSKRNSSPAAESSVSRPVSWKRGFNRSVSPDNRFSGSPRDSGYASGRSSLLVPIAEDTPPHPDSLKEFNGMYRVPCYDLHEPSFSEQEQETAASTSFQNLATCGHCSYSGIHSLSWSSQNMSAREFKEVLRSDHLDFSAVDAAGNSALHYAAAGGASYEHLTALIDVGVDPYRINTLGQLFLHYIVPSPELMCDSLISLFRIDLVNFLNSLGSRGLGAVTALRWRDNEGRTVLDAIAAHTECLEGGTQILQLVKDAFFPLEKPTQFGTQVQNLKPQRHHSTSGRNKDTAVDNKFAIHQNRQSQAYEIVGQACLEPSYVDPDTGDNVLHALSRLRLPKSSSLLEKIRDFISKDVDLNVHNRERDSPLAAFIRERPFFGVESDETGATMSKYLDALLWKDTRHRVPNKINVNMKNREGATALYYAAVRARPDSVRSLIEAGANVNARIAVDGQSISILQATLNAKSEAVLAKNSLKIHLFDNVISYLEHDGAVTEPTIMVERGIHENTVTDMPK